MKKPVTAFLAPLLVFCLIFPIFSRGAWEFLFQSKFVAYILQFACTSLCLALVFLNNRKGIKFNPKDPYLWMIALFFVSQVVSGILTVSKSGFFREVAVFCLITDFLILFLIAGYYGSMDGNGLPAMLVRVLFIIGLLNFLAALLEMSFGTNFTIPFLKNNPWLIPIFNTGGYYIQNGVVLVRPTGLTGSFLHLPIILPLIGAAVFRFEKNIVLRVFGILFVLLPFATLSRSGMMIGGFVLASLVGIGICRYVALIKRHIKIKAVLLVLPLLFPAACALIILFVPPINHYAALIWSRITSLGDAGNLARFNIWSSHLKVFLATNLTFGEYTGYSTNIVSNILGHSRLSNLNVFTGGVPESSILSLLVSFGIAGLLAFYGLLIAQIVRLFKRKEFFLGVTFIGAVLQTFFYQSIEVLPFMFCLALIPFLANSHSRHPEKRHPVLITRSPTA